MTTPNDRGECPPVRWAVNDRLAVLLPVLVLASLLVVYGVQAGLGHWQVDEFLYFASHRALGWRAYVDRLYVSPRPLSELLIYAYGSAVLAFDRDFITGVLLLIWGGSLAGIGVAAYATLRPGPGRAFAAMALAAAPMVLVLQIAPVTEMFYWPVATVAYVPTVAAITALLFLLADADRAPRWGWCGLALMVAVVSHEIGAAAAIGFGLASGAFGLLAARRERYPAMWWLVPAATGLLVMLGLVLFRSGTVDLGSDTKPYTGRLFASAMASVRQMVIDAGTTATFPDDAAGMAAGLAQKIEFAAGFALIWIRWGFVRPNRWQLSLAVGIAVGIFFSLLAAHYHYGDLCCERHAATRQWLIELLFILAAASVLLRWPARQRSRRQSWYGPLLLIASLLPVIGLLPAIRSDLQVLGMGRIARVKTWQSGLAPGPQMQFYMPPDNKDMLIHGTSMGVGTYDLTDGSLGPLDLARAIGVFFGKTSVVACQAWQTRDSFLIDGQFIPACPPHDGPPDIVFNTR